MMPNPVGRPNINRGMMPGETARLRRALDHLRAGECVVLILAEDEASWGALNLGHPRNAARVSALTIRQPDLIVGYYRVTKELSVEKVREMMTDDLFALGAI